jgi:hypothetical protein
MTRRPSERMRAAVEASKVAVMEFMEFRDWTGLNHIRLHAPGRIAWQGPCSDALKPAVVNLVETRQLESRVNEGQYQVKRTQG